MEKPLLVWLRTELVEVDQVLEKLRKEEAYLRREAGNVHERWEKLCRRMDSLRTLAESEGIDVGELLDNGNVSQAREDKTTADPLEGIELLEIPDDEGGK